MTQSASVKIPGNADFCGGELRNSKLQSLVSKDSATEADFWYDSVNHRPVYHNGTTVKVFGTEYSAFTGADGTNAGTSGLVPAPAATDDTKFLCGDGTFKTPAGRNYAAGSGINSTALANATIAVDITTTIGTTATASNTVVPSELAVRGELNKKENKGFVTCSTQASTAYKSVTLPSGFELYNGARLTVLFTNGNSSNSMYINNTPVYYKGANSVNELVFSYEFIADFIYNTNKWVLVSFIGDGLVVFKKNGTAFKTIGVNQTHTVNIDYTIPTAVTDLSDASNYALKSDVASAIIPKGSISAVSGLPTLVADHRGWMYNFDTAFTTTSDFVEGSGLYYPAGTNVVVVEYSSGTYKYDVFSGFVDTTTYDNHIANTTVHVTSTEKSTWNGKQDALTAGSNITISGGTISATDTTYSAGSNVQISNGTISATDTTYTFSTGLTNTSGTVTVTDYNKLAKKYATVNPALTSSNGVVTWTITNSATSADVDVSIYEVGSTSNTRIYPAIDVNASNIVMTMLSSSNVSAGALKAVTVG